MFLIAFFRQFPDIPERRDRVLPLLVGRGSGGKSKEPLFCCRGQGVTCDGNNLCVGALRVEGCMGGGKQCPVRRRGDDAGRLCFFERAADIDERLGERIA